MNVLFASLDDFLLFSHLPTLLLLMEDTLRTRENVYTSLSEPTGGSCQGTRSPVLPEGSFEASFMPLELRRKLSLRALGYR